MNYWAEIERTFAVIGVIFFVVVMVYAIRLCLRPPTGAERQK